MDHYGGNIRNQSDFSVVASGVQPERTFCGNAAGWKSTWIWLEVPRMCLWSDRLCHWDASVLWPLKAFDDTEKSTTLLHTTWWFHVLVHSQYVHHDHFSYHFQGQLEVWLVTKPWKTLPVMERSLSFRCWLGKPLTEATNTRYRNRTATQYWEIM